MLADIGVEDEEPGQWHQVGEVESFVRVFAVLRIEFLLINTHSCADKESDGQQGYPQDPVKEDKRGI